MEESFALMFWKFFRSANILLKNTLSFENKCEKAILVALIQKLITVP
jgi:hypothetical protein